MELPPTIVVPLAQALKAVSNQTRSLIQLRINWAKFRSAQDRVLPTYWQLKQLPEYCLNHGVATSLDYSDSDQNLVDGL